MRPRPARALYPRVRIEALTDGIYAVAMTLLVLDIRLPEDFHPTSAEQLLHALLGLWPKLTPYVLSFVVLGLRWVSSIRVHSTAESIEGGPYIRWWLLYLLLVTCVPFTTLVVGRYASFAPAIWLYGGNTALIALASWRLLSLTPEVTIDHHLRGRRASLLVLFGSTLLMIAWSFVDPQQALWALALNLVAPALTRSSDPTSQPTG